jgi:rhodanese-related sulfurtransferase
VQKKSNYALVPMSKTDFVRMLTENLPEMPAYFSKSVAKNLAGAGSLADLPKPKVMLPQEVKDFEGLILDVRNADEFGAGHIPNSLNIGLGGQFASWAGTLIEAETSIVVVAESEEKVEETVVRLARVGIETVKGFLKNGIPAWQQAGFETAEIEQISVEEMNNRLAENGDLQFIDVRRAGEFESGHAPKTVNLTLSDLDKLDANLDPSRPTYVICQGGYRSSAGTSILERKGFGQLYNISGGTAAWIKAEFETEKI